MVSGRYRVIRLLGEGAMGAVYEAEHVHMHKRMALKVLHAETTQRPDLVERFEREAIAAGHIDHPNVAAATDFGKLDDGAFFLVLEYIVGRSLRDELAHGRFELGRALHVARQIAGAVGAAHRRGIVHRDLKPENVMLTERGADRDSVKVLDFGIAKVPVDELSGAPSDGGRALTRAGMIFGTPDYMAPEQAVGDHVDARADLYSLGVMMFELLTGSRPFDHDSVATLLTMHISAPVPAMASVAADAAVPPEIEAIVGKLLAKEPGQRFQTADELLAALAVATGQAPATSAVVASQADSTGAAAALRSEGWRATATSAIERARQMPRPIALGVAGGAALLFLVLGLVVGRSPAPTSAGLIAPASSVPPPPVDDGTAARLAEAEAAEGKGDYATALAILAPLASSAPRAPAVHHDLARAELGVGNMKGALAETRAWLTADPAAGRDAKLEEAVKAAALGGVDAEDAFDLLQNHMGTVGAETLYDLAYPSSNAPGSPRARALLATPAVRRNASPALAVTLDLRAAQSCEAKRALLPRAREVGDARTLAVVSTYRGTSGCGFLGRRDCLPCMRRAGGLTETIATLEARAGKP
jgi:serine/threonine-protein kinase